MAILDSACPLDCPDTCSLSVTVEDGRITKVDGSHRNPFTEGFICSKVRRSPQRVYSPLRLLYPQRRVGPKGSGRFERISWSAAIDSIAQCFKQIVQTDGAEAILPYHYGGSSGLLGEGALDQRFFNRLGASELLKTLCAAPTSTTYRAMFGAMGGVPPEDYHLARAILLWGVNPSATSIHLVPKVRAAQDAGAFVAVIDPRRTPLAKQADLHLQPRPGTDVVLALALIDVLIRNARVDHDFIAAHVNGFKELAEAVVAPSYAAEVCDVPERDIIELAERYAGASPAVVRCGWGVERNRNGGNAVRAILALAAVAGKLGVRAGGVTMSLGRSFPINNQALSRPDLRRKPVRQLNMTQLGRILTEPQTPPVRGLFVYNANPVAVTPNQNLIIRGLQRDDLFTVVHEQVMTDTALFADILLPATTMFEQRNLLKSYGNFRLQTSEPVIAPVGESKSNVELFQLLSRVMGFDEAELYADEGKLIDDALLGADDRIVGGRAALHRDGCAAIKFNGGSEVVQFVTTFPTTASAKIELCPPELGVPRFEEVPASKYPLSLLSPATSKTINSIFGEFNLPNPRLDMNT
ncbi:MAG: molybdopterin-dependent oxidoreductase, partial [Deltaproteobacteria bacterium]|nr:molybdopterin-dependent oxidoreductase [Deltaproteobacteria bacterium]